MTEESIEKRVKRLEAELAQRSRDIQSVTRAHATMSKRTRMFERIHLLFEAPERIEENLALVLDVLLEEFDVEAGSVLLIDGEEREFFFAAVRGPAADQLADVRFPVEMGIAGACARTRDPIFVSDVDKDPNFYRKISDSVGFNVSSLLALPMRDGEGICGVIELINKRGGGAFHADEIETADRISDLAARLVTVGIEMRGRQP